MKRFIFFAFIGLLIAAATIGAGCMSSSSLEQPLDLTIASRFLESYSDIFPTMQAFVDDVNASLDVNLHFYHPKTSLKADELVRGLEKGTYDMIFITSSYASDVWPVMNVMALPFIFDDAEYLADKMSTDGKLRKLIDEQLIKNHGIYVVASGSLPLEYLWTTNKPVRDPNDMKGMRIRVAGTVESKTVSNLGAFPVIMPSEEIYQALHSGNIDAVMSYCGVVGGRGLYEELRYCTMANFSAYTFDILMKKSKWDQLPGDVRNIFSEAGYRYEYDFLKTAMEVHEADYWPHIRQSGIEIIELSPAELEVFKQATMSTLEWFQRLVGPDIGKQLVEAAIK